MLNTNSIRYNRQLKKASIYTLERTKLFKLISLKQKTEKKVVKTTKKQSIKEKLNIGKPLIFNEKEQHSFSEWLTLLQTKKIDRKSPVPTDNILVNKFLDNKQQINRAKKNLFFKATNIAKNSLVENDDLVTPTLAKVYLEQGHYDKAIGAYNKLILKYPKKSTFFAAQIELIKNKTK